MLSNFVGEVKDSTQAVVPNADVTVTNQGTGAVRTVKTDSTGSYRIDGILVGNYTLKVEVAGFNTYLQQMYSAPALSSRGCPGSTHHAYSVVRRLPRCRHQMNDDHGGKRDRHDPHEPPEQRAD